MCGISVFVSVKGNEQCKETVAKSINLLVPRGPNSSNIVAIFAKEDTKDDTSGPTVILGHTRLAITGNDDATQPLTLKKGNRIFHLVHNGEIYNYPDLRHELIANGNCIQGDFKTGGDSEVLLACLAHRGIDWTLGRIRGMFAFVFVESMVTSVTKVILCRDAFGIKPLCYSFDEQQENLFISSEIAAIPRDIGLSHIQDVLPSTYTEVSISRSSLLTCENRYETLGSINVQNENRLSHAQQLSEIRLRLIDAVSVRIPEVPFAVLLSGGLDSSIICRLAADLIYPETLHAFTITSSEEEDEQSGDCHFAKLVAEEAPNILHEEVRFTSLDGIEALPEVVKSLESSDPAMVRAGVPLYLLSKHISSLGFKVVLCGEGADESLAGYRLFEQYFFNDQNQFEHELNRRLFNIDTSELQRVDRCTSAHGLEARVPYMDVSYVKAVMQIDIDQVSSFQVNDSYLFIKYTITYMFSHTSSLKENHTPINWSNSKVFTTKGVR